MELLLTRLVDVQMENAVQGGKQLCPEDVGTYLDSAIRMLGRTVSEQEYARIVRYLEERYRITHTTSCAIYDEYEVVRDWYDKAEIEDPFFWTRYKEYLAKSTSIDPKSIDILDKETLPRLMNSLGDPKAVFEGKSLRRGMVIGDVQSGKTATYTGLICKAADAGYKVVILLAGITESLRQQTQMRIDEGIVGLATTKVPGLNTNDTKRVGVGLDNQSLRATSMTTQASDFVGRCDNITTSLASHKMVIFVVKKNVSVLNRLHRWLKSHNYDSAHGYIDAPMLLIDDEADNASVNTNKDETNPTKTNAIIRKVCDLFKNATYVGFTATPFANCFIDPDSVTEMCGADLFPQHFMIVLPIPSTYIGAKQIFYDDSPYRRSIRHITDIEEPDYTSDEFREMMRSQPGELNAGPFYYKHMREWDGVLPQSLTEAIYCFFLANVVRDLRGESKKPRSMMVNMSRFVPVQQVIKEHVEQICASFKDEVECNFTGTSVDERLPLYQQLAALWRKHYGFIRELPMARVLDKANLLNAVRGMQVMVVNGSRNSDKLDYVANKSLRVIAVGGIALSRGLTLEGLMMSYFYRNTATFDVLMQMGRWFGYRPHYEDLFQIWTSATSARWYKEISQSAEELKDDLRTMYEKQLTPKEFGIKVRDVCDELQITAANKMRTAIRHSEVVSYYGNLFETPYVSMAPGDNVTNEGAVAWLEQRLRDGAYAAETLGNKNPATVWRDIPKGVVREFMGGITCSRVNPSFDVERIGEFIDEPSTKGLELWDVVLTSVNRTIHIEKNAVALSSRRRLTSANAGKLALTEEQMVMAEAECRRRWEAAGENAEGREIPSKAYFEFLPKRKPLLIVLRVNATPEEGETAKLHDYIASLGGAPVVAFAAGFPGVRAAAKARRYMVTKDYYRLYLADSEDESEDDE